MRRRDHQSKPRLASRCCHRYRSGMGLGADQCTRPRTPRKAAGRWRCRHPRNKPRPADKQNHKRHSWTDLAADSDRLRHSSSGGKDRAGDTPLPSKSRQMHSNDRKRRSETNSPSSSRIGPRTAPPPLDSLPLPRDQNKRAPARGGAPWGQRTGSTETVFLVFASSGLPLLWNLQVGVGSCTWLCNIRSNHECRTQACSVRPHSRRTGLAPIPSLQVWPNTGQTWPREVNPGSRPPVRHRPHSFRAR